MRTSEPGGEVGKACLPGFVPSTLTAQWSSTELGRREGPLTIPGNALIPLLKGHGLFEP